MEWIPLKKKISNLKPQVSFYLKFASLFNAIGDKSSVLFWLKLYLIFNLIIFSAKVQNFRLSTVQVKFHQICTLIGYFCWSYIKFQLKKHGGVMSHDIKEWYKIWSVTDFFFFKNDTNLMNFDPSKEKPKKFALWFVPLCKVYNIWPKKNTEEYISWHWRVM